MVLLTIKSQLKKWPRFVRTTRAWEKADSSTGHQAIMDRAIRMATKVETWWMDMLSIRMGIATRKHPNSLHRLVSRWTYLSRMPSLTRKSTTCIITTSGPSSISNTGLTGLPALTNLILNLTMKSRFKKWPRSVRTTRASDKMDSTTGRQAMMNSSSRIRLVTMVSGQARSMRLATKMEKWWRARVIALKLVESLFEEYLR